MGPMGICHTTIVLGPKSFRHSFIVCHDLTSSLILGLDFSSQQQIGSDWTPDGCMYLHQEKEKLIEGTISTMAVKRPRLVMKTKVSECSDQMDCSSFLEPFLQILHQTWKVN